ncbi:jupiter microtubule associated homolog 2-like [Conger conger]|uniref:jupiter microtubule associated homolog 2-like n=1 Tax=Conger conger TaxID=82655 RepID=UPI002A5A9F26|nr:jupiter microtubule associated homolog 2-like [Conger conger]
MTSTNMFQGLENDGKPSSRGLRPPGGASSDLFGQCEDVSPARRPHKMSSTIFSPPEQPQESPKRSNPPGGKSSVVFGAAPSQAPGVQQKAAPSAGVSSNIFGDGESDLPAPRSHPNKPKDNIGIHGTPRPEAPEPKVASPEKETTSTPPAADGGVSTPPPKQEAYSPSHGPSVEDHEPRLGPRPRSHNKVIQPPGGKSSVVFY